MTSTYLLVSTLPGMQRKVFERISSLPHVQAETILFGEQIAVQLDPLADAHADPARLASIDGVVEARAYRGDHAWTVRNRLN
ncbi:MAG TPA: hypothetical protein VM681_03055 [Candidatus Thermoplasmatota archaeon]|nr:hypothetical protein [Candidatus Thermoplasmatota archaeon]